MIFKQGIAIVLILLCSTALADNATYLVEAKSSTGIVQGAAFTNSNEYQVNGFLVSEYNVTHSFSGVWTRLGKIEAVDRQGNMYSFDVIKLLNDAQTRILVHRF